MPSTVLRASDTQLLDSLETLRGRQVGHGEQAEGDQILWELNLIQLKESSLRKKRK